MSKLHSIESLDMLIKNCFKASLMSNSKWDKALELITDLFEDGVALNYKLVYGCDIFNTYIWAPDFVPFFQEPLLYKELEWIEIPSEFIGPISRNNLKAGELIHKQNILKIPEELKKIGDFDLEINSSGIKIYGYR